MAASIDAPAPRRVALLATWVCEGIGAAVLFDPMTEVVMRVGAWEAVALEADRVG